MYSRTFEKKEKPFYSGKFFMRNLRDIKKPCKLTDLSIGALLGKLEGVRLLGLLRGKKMRIWVPFLGPRGL